MKADTVLSLPLHHRRTFLALIGLAILILFLSIGLSTSFGSAVLAVVSSLVSGMVTTLILIGIGYYFLPNSARKNAIREVDPTEITRQFDDELSLAQNWYFAGNLGRYLRSRVLETLSAKGGTTVHANIMDPSKPELIREHVQYRNKISRVDSGSDVSFDSILSELITTIVVCAWYNKAKNIGIFLRVHKAFSPIRIDGSDDRLFLTVEDRREPALAIDKHHFMYKNYRQQIDFLRLQGSEIDLKKFPVLGSLHSLSGDQLRSFVSDIGYGSLLSDDIEERVLAGVKEIKNPYP